MKKHQWLAALCATTMAFTAIATDTVSAATVITENKTGTEDGYSYELWKDYGDTTMTLLGNGTFSCEWSNINNALFRTGQKFDCTQSYKDFGRVTVEYACDYNPNGNSYLCVYGWTRNPLIEYYIVDSWGTWRPPGGDSIGSITADGAVYDVYKTIRENQPSIDGNTTFYQYWSVRREKRTSGTISVHEHFAAWEEMGLDMSGKFYEVALTVEGYQSSGKATVTKNILTMGGEATTTTAPPPVEPDADGYYFYDTFEEDMGGWNARGSSSLGYSSYSAMAGNSSLYVTDRADTWNGAGHDLSAGTFVPGKNYAFGASVMQESGSTQNILLTLQYNDANGETQYTTVASAEAASGEWVNLENTSFTIPAGASSMLLYVEIADTTCDFYMDEAYGGIEGVTGKTPVATTTTTTITTTTTLDTTTSTTTTGTPEPTVIGDVNCDGNVKIGDVILLNRFISEDAAVSVTNQGLANAEVDGVKGINSDDSTAILKIIAGL